MTVINTWHLVISNTVGPNQEFVRMHGMPDFSFYCKTEIILSVPLYNYAKSSVCTN